LIQLLVENRLRSHPMIIGELAIGGMANRFMHLNLMANIVVDALATHDEVLNFVDQETIYGVGIGWIDAHLIVSTVMNPNLVFWTRDKRIRSLSLKPIFSRQISLWP